jgi:HEAT repeat protein
MTALQKTIVTATIAVLLGAGIYCSLRRQSDTKSSSTISLNASSGTNTSNFDTAPNSGPSNAMPREIQVLLSKLKSLDTETRLHAIQAIGHLGPKGAEAVPNLIPLLDDQERSVRILTAHALGKIGPDASLALPALRKQARLRNAAEQSTANRAIRKIEN